MNQLTTEFFKSSSIPQNPDTVRIMDFLSQPESVNKMIVMSEVGLPALAGVVTELEQQFGNCKFFPLNHDAKDANAPNRRNVGLMVRFIMNAYGYTSVVSGLPNANDIFAPTQIGNFVDSKYFGSSAVYKKTIPDPDYSIEVKSVHKNKPSI